MKIKFFIATLALVSFASSCQKEEILTPTDSNEITPAYLLGDPTPCDDCPPPSEDSGGNPFEIGEPLLG